MSDVPMPTDEITQEDKTMATIACVLGLTLWVGPLIIYLLKKDQSKFVAYYSLQAICFGVIINVLYILAPITLTLSFWLGGILNIVFIILTAMAANRGAWYEIPVVGKFAKQKAGITV
jgi:hypothetical protein